MTLRASLSAAAILLATTTAQAAVVTIDVHLGEMQNNGAFSSSISSGTFSFDIDDSTAVQTSFGGVDTVTFSVTNALLTLGTSRFSSSTDGLFSVAFGNPLDVGTVEGTLEVADQGDFLGKGLTYSLSLFYQDKQLVTDNSFFSGQVTGETTSFVSPVVTAAPPSVPLPGSGWALSATLAALAGFGRVRANKT